MPEAEAITAMPCDIITPRQTVFSEPTQRLVVHGIAGNFEILPGHEAVMTPLAISLMEVFTSGDQKYVFAIHGGFLDMDGQAITVLADTAERADKIDIERAQKALSRAKDRLEVVSSADAHEIEIDIDRAKLALLRATMRMQAGQAQEQGN